MRARVAPRWLVLAGCLVVLIYAYPGHLDGDGLLQLRHVRRGGISPDAPVFSLIWRVTAIFVAGPLGMLLLQLGAFAWGTYCLLERRVGQRAGLATLAILVAPPMLVTLSTVTPWTLSAALLIAMFGAMYGGMCGGTSFRVSLAVGALAILVLPTAAIATPLLALRIPSKGQRYAVLGGILILLLVSLALPLETTRYRFDIAGTLAAGTSADRIDVLRDTGLAPGVDRAAIVAAYRANDPASLRAVWPQPVDTVMPYAQRRQLLAARNQIVAADNSGYVAHRIRAFAAVLGLTERRNHLSVPPRTFASRDQALALRLGVPTDASQLQRAITAVCSLLARFTPLLWPALYLVAALAVLWRRRDDRELVAFVASGIAFELVLVVSSAGAGLWQSTFLIAVTLIALVASRLRAFA